MRWDGDRHTAVIAADQSFDFNDLDELPGEDKAPSHHSDGVADESWAKDILSEEETKTKTGCC